MQTIFRKSKRNVAWRYMKLNDNAASNTCWELLNQNKSFLNFYNFQAYKGHLHKNRRRRFIRKGNWQIIQEENLYLIGSISTEEKEYLFETAGINSQGQLLRDNFRLNLYANFICTFGKNVNLNAFVNVQEPFIPPYENLPPDPRFPVVTKRYPRITTNMHLSVSILKSFDLVTDFTLQYDKGQIPLYVPNFVYSLTQGLEFDF